MLPTAWFTTVLALTSLSSAFNLGEGLHIDGIEAYLHHGEKRQASGTGNNNNSPTSAAPPASTPPPATTPRPTTPAPTSKPADPTTQPTTDPTDAPTTPPPQQSSQAPPPATSQPPATTAPRSSAGGNAPATSGDAPSTTLRTTPIVRTSALVSTSLQPFTTTIKTTLSNGVPTDIVSTGVNSIPITTGQSTYTDPPEVQNGSNSNESGLTDSNKKVIGGVVGGIGGALLLGGIALVFWRMKKRQNKVTADDDDLNLNTGAALGDKPQNGTGASPFQSNLEQYHNPGGRPNAAANF
jgi:hypothetical protein